MLKKLLKNEFIATGRWMVVIYAILFGVTLINKVMFELRSGDEFFNVYNKNLLINFFSGIMVLTYVLIIIGSVGLCVVFIVKRYYDNMYKDEGYLTFTLPVSAKEHLISKVLVAFTWYLLTTVSVVASVLIMASGHGVIKPLWNNISEMIKGNEKEAIIIVFLVIAEVLALAIMPFFCITLGQNFREHRVLGAFVVYGAIYGINQILGLIFIMVWTRGKMYKMNSMAPNQVVRTVIIYQTILVLTEIIITTLLTHRELEKNVNVE